MCRAQSSENSLFRSVSDCGAVVERMRGGLAADELALAVDAGVVVPVAGAAERYRFSHALVTETLYADMPPSSRVALHQAAATALLSFWGSAIDEHLDEVAHEGEQLPNASV